MLFLLEQCADRLSSNDVNRIADADTLYGSLFAYNALKLRCYQVSSPLRGEHITSIEPTCATQYNTWECQHEYSHINWILFTFDLKKILG